MTRPTLSDADLIELGRIVERSLSLGLFVIWGDDMYVDPAPSDENPRFLPGVCIDATVPVTAEALAILKRYGD